MPSSSTGKWVQRAASTGGGRTYRGQRPTNWYAALVIIVVVGLLSVVLARHDYQHRTGAPKVEPTVGTTWYSAEGFNICGVVEKALAVPSPQSTTGMTVDGAGSIVIKPTKSSQAGDNAVLSQFIDGYQGLTLTSSTIGYPGKQVYKNGDKCPKGTPDAGKVGTVQTGYWPNIEAKAGAYQRVSDPPSFKPANGSEFTFNFLPAGATLKKPPGTAVADMLKGFEASQAPSTTTSSPTGATVPVSTTPTVSTTTASPTTTTTK
jgi:hypothetical protein